jgi:hypothetical protein
MFDDRKRFLCNLKLTWLVLHIYKSTYLHIYIHTYLHTYISTYLHTYLHTVSQLVKKRIVFSSKEVDFS